MADSTAAPNTLLARLESTSPDLPVDQLRISTVTGTEQISQLFTFTILVACLEPDDFVVSKVIGVEVSLVFEVDGDEVRRIHGMIAEVNQVFQADTTGNTVYRLTLVPRAYRLALISTQEVFLDIACPNVAKEKLRRVGLMVGTDVALNLTGGYFPPAAADPTSPYPVRPFIIQFLETDLAFISRLMEGLGISYFFDQSTGVDKIVLVDTMSGFLPIKGSETATFRLGGEQHGVFEFRHQTRVMPKTWIVQDYNFDAPHIDLTGTYVTPDGFAGGVVEYGPNVQTPAEGKVIARIRAEERDALYHPYFGSSDIITFTAGASVKLEGSMHVPDMSVVITQIQHTFWQPSPLVGTSPPVPYTNTFTALDSAMPYRPQRITPKPRIPGLLTGRVEPPRLNKFTTEEPANDADGNYTIRLHFDTSALNKRVHCSLPVRMIQSLAGPGYGMHFPLRPGVEVLLSFIDGDPDRPIIVGAVPNALVPMPLPSASSQYSMLKSVSGMHITFKDPTPGT